MYCIWTSGVSRDLGLVLKNIHGLNKYTRSEDVIGN